MSKKVFVSRRIGDKRIRPVDWNMDVLYRMTVKIHKDYMIEVKKIMAADPKYDLQTFFNEAINAKILTYKRKHGAPKLSDEQKEQIKEAVEENVARSAERQRGYNEKQMQKLRDQKKG